MRVLLLNPVLPTGNWSFQRACECARAKTFVAPLGLITIAAMLPAEWELRFVDLNARRPAEQEWRWADLVMISGMLTQRANMRNLIREAKRRGKTVAAGGPYATSLPGEVLDAGVDFLVRGEAEETVPLLVAALRDGAAGAVFEESAKPDLAKSPVPRFDLLQFEDYVVLPIQTSRGCPYDCEFCDVVNLNGHRPRYKDPDQVLRELQAVYDLGWRGQMFICDDNFVGNRQHAGAILRKLIPWMKCRGEPFVFATQASVNLGQDSELMALMTEANFNHVLVGVESPDDDILTHARKHQNVRHPLVESLRNMNRSGLNVMASFIIGFDGETRGTGGRIAEFVEDLAIPIAVVNTLRVLPNTNLWKRLKREGRLIEDESDATTIGGALNYVPTRPEAEILAEFVDTVNRIYEPLAYLKRVGRYFAAMRPTRAALGLETKNAGRSRKKPAVADALRFFWRHGVQSEYRARFWRQMLGMWRKNPSRLVYYLANCELGESLFHFREYIARRAAESRTSPGFPCRPD